MHDAWERLAIFAMSALLSASQGETDRDTNRGHNWPVLPDYFAMFVWVGVVGRCLHACAIVRN